MKSDLYYEAHITIEPVFDETLKTVSNICRKHSFHIADLLMQKRKEDKPERSKYDTFATTRGVYYDDIVSRTQSCVNELLDNGFSVWRYKIEDTMLDIKLK